MFEPLSLNTTAEPQWLQVLRRDVAASSQRAMARKLNVNPRIINHVLRGIYEFTPHRLKAAVEAQLMNSHVFCPAVGQMPTRACRRWQTRTHPTMDPIGQRIMRTCPTCPNNLRRQR